MRGRRRRRRNPLLYPSITFVSPSLLKRGSDGRSRRLIVGEMSHVDMSHDDLMSLHLGWVRGCVEMEEVGGWRLEDGGWRGACWVRLGIVRVSPSRPFSLCLSGER